MQAAPPRAALLTACALLAFAGNSLLCRLALRGGHIDPPSFTVLRIVSGALALYAVAVLGRQGRPTGDWGSALALAAYAVAFCFAYLTLPAGTGALLLFGAVQATMLLAGFVAGERFGAIQTLGFVLALGGLVYLVSPGLAAPEPAGAVLMLAAGCAWGVYSLRGRRAGAPVSATTGNFLRASPLVLVAAVPFLGRIHTDAAGLGCALLSGVVTSGLGYVAWYAALRSLSAAAAGVVQLSVPVIAAFGGVLFLAEPLTARLAYASVAVLGGIGLTLLRRRVSG